MPNSRLEAVTKEDLVRAAKSLSPKRIQKWSVIVGAKEFPVKQILMEGANSIRSNAPRVTPADFTAHYAVSRLRKMDFDVRYSG